MSFRMLRKTHQSNTGLLLSHGRCSDELRALATSQDWPILEGVDSTRGIHACVAIEPGSVCVEYLESINSVPDLITRLSELNSIGRVACLVPSVSPMLERSLALIGAQALTSTNDLSSWMGLCEQGLMTRTGHQCPPQRTSPRARRVTRRIHQITKGVER